MGVLHLEFFSCALRKQSPLTILFPDRIKHPGPYPVLYLLHGLGDDNSAWTRQTSLERHVQSLPLIVVMPDGQRSFYTDAANGMAFEQLIVRDVIETVQRLFKTCEERAGRCIGGLSMGGYGALKLALKYPQLFISAASHSSAIFQNVNQMPIELQVEFTALYGGVRLPDEENCFTLAQRNAGRADLPALRFDCGTDDFLLRRNREFHQHLQQLGIAHEYEEFPGAHTWAYWDEHVREALAFHARQLGIEPAPPLMPSYTPPVE